MPFDCSRGERFLPRLGILGGLAAIAVPQAPARGFSLGSLSIAVVAAIVLGGALALFSLATLRASSEALGAVALAAAVREAAEQSQRPSERGPVADAICAALARDLARCPPKALSWWRRGPVLLQLEAAAIDDGLLRLRWRAEQGRRVVRTEAVVARNDQG